MSTYTLKKPIKIKKIRIIYIFIKNLLKMEHLLSLHSVQANASKLIAGNFIFACESIFCSAASFSVMHAVCKSFQSFYPFMILIQFTFMQAQRIPIFIRKKMFPVSKCAVT